VAIGGIALATGALIVLLSGFNGISDLVRSLYNSFGADIQITAVKGKTFIPNGPKFESVKHINGVKYFSEVMRDKALLTYNGQQTLAVLKGVSTDFRGMTQFDTLMRSGNFFLQRGSFDYGVFGRGVADQLNLTETNIDYISIACYAPKRGLKTGPNPTDAITELHIFPAGVFSINDDFDYRYVIVSLPFARQLFDYPDSSVTSVEIGLAKNANLDETKQKIKETLGSDYLVKDRTEQNEMLFRTLKTEKLLTAIILALVMIIATFNIVGSLSMLILDKEKDINILWNMGANMQTVRRIFLFEGMLITLVGIAIGLIIGTLLCLAQMYFKFVHIGNGGFVVNAYPMRLLFTDYLAIFAAVLLVGFLSSWYPVRVFASKNAQKAD